MMPGQHEEIAGEGQQAEEGQRPALSPMICQPAARIGIERPEQRLERVEKSDDKDACAEGLQVFWGEAEPKLLAGTGEKLWLGFAPKYLQTLGASVLVKASRRCRRG